MISKDALSMIFAPNLVGPSHRGRVRDARKEAAGKEAKRRLAMAWRGLPARGRAEASGHCKPDDGCFLRAMSENAPACGWAIGGAGSEQSAWRDRQVQQGVHEFKRGQRVELCANDGARF
jgi:hypothetical protein